MTGSAEPPARALAAVSQAAMFVFGIVMALVGAVVPSLTERLPLTLADVGTLFLAMNFSMLVASLVLGLVVDRVGLKLPLALGAALVAVALVLIATAGALAPLVAAVACLGFGGGALNGGANTLVADLHRDPRRKAAALNLLGVFFGFGALFLPFSLGALTSRFGAGGLLQAAAALSLAIGLASAALAFPTPKQRQGWPLAELPRFVRMPVVRALALLLFFQSGNEFVLGGYIASFLTRELDVALGTASYWLAAYWAAIMVIRMVLSRLLLRVNASAVVLAGAVLSAAGALTIGFSGSATLAGVGIVLTGLALGGIFPTVLGLAGTRLPAHSGTVFGILFTAALTGGMLMPWISGHLAEASGLPRVFALVAINFAIIGLVSTRAARPGPAAGLPGAQPSALR